MTSMRRRRSVSGRTSRRRWMRCSRSAAPEAPPRCTAPPLTPPPSRGRIPKGAFRNSTRTVASGSGRLTMTSTSPPAALRVGIVGTGGISRAHLPGWVDVGAELHCFSLSGAEASAAASGTTVHGSLEELLAAVDVVDVCTPTPAHPEIVRAALEAGKDVVSEKPIALDPAVARELADLAENVGRRLFPAHVVRFFPQYEAAKQALDAG